MRGFASQANLRIEITRLIVRRVLINVTSVSIAKQRIPL